MTCRRACKRIRRSQASQRLLCSPPGPPSMRFSPWRATQILCFVTLCAVGDSRRGGDMEACLEAQETLAGIATVTLVESDGQTARPRSSVSKRKIRSSTRTSREPEGPVAHALQSLLPRPSNGKCFDRLGCSQSWSLHNTIVRDHRCDPLGQQ